MSPENVALYAMIARLREAVRHNDRDVRDFLESVLTEWTELRGQAGLREVGMDNWRKVRVAFETPAPEVVYSVVSPLPGAEYVETREEVEPVESTPESTPEYAQCIACQSRIAVERDKRGHRMTMCGSCRSARSLKANAAKDTAPPPTDTPAEVVCCKCGCPLPGERNKVGQLVTTCATCQSAQGRAAAMQSAKVRAERKQAAADAAPNLSSVPASLEDEVRRRLGAIMEQLGACEVEDLTRVSAAVKVPIHRVRAIHGELADDRRKKLGNGGRLPERGDPAPVGMETLP